MPLLDQQRATYQIGRIRIGEQVAVANKPGKSRPARLEHFRFTTSSRSAAEEIARLYGGEARPWDGHKGEFEVFTQVSEIGVTVSPYDDVVTQWYEKWTGGGCERRCDSETEKLTGKPCLCPADPKVRSELAAKNPPQACKAITRISLVLPDLPGIGVWRLDTHSWYAAGEMADQARVLELARNAGVFVPAVLRIEQRSRVAGGETKRFPVPVLQPLVTIRQLVSGQLESGGMAAQLPPPPGQALAIGAGQAAAPAAVAPPAAAAPPAAREAAAPPAADDHADDAADEDARHRLAKDIAARARAADPDEHRGYIRQVKGDQALGEEYVEAEPGSDHWVPLRDYLDQLWQDKVAAAKAGSNQPEGA